MRALPDYIGDYSINEKGEVWSHPKPQRHKGIWLKQLIDKKGYHYIKVTSGKYYTHKLMLLIFHGIEGQDIQGFHIDGDRDNNHYSNIASHDKKMRIGTVTYGEATH